MGAGKFNNLPVFFNKPNKVKKVVVNVKAVTVKAFKISLAYF